MQGAIGPYYHATLGRYGNDSEVFRAAVTSRLTHWGFNGLGAWCTSEFWTDAPGAITYSIDVEMTRNAPPSMVLGPWSDMPDAFSPAWLSYIDGRARNTCAPLVNSTNLMGYFTDNELNWPHFNDAERSFPPSPTPVPFTAHGPTLLQIALSVGPAYTTYSVAWTWLLNRYAGSLSKLSGAWQLPAPLGSQSDVLRLYTNASLTIASAAYQADDDAFMAVYASQYWNVTAAAIRRYDSNHLVMGAKFGSVTSTPVYTAMAPFQDVCSADNYRYNMSDRIRDFARSGLPVLIAEFSWEGSGCPVPDSDELQCCEPGADPSVGGFPCPVPNEPASANLTNLDRMYCNGAYAALKAFTEPTLVGWTWYRWVDYAGDSPSPFQELGLVDIWDRVKPYAISYISAINALADGIHESGQLPSPPGPAWLQYCPVY